MHPALSAVSAIALSLFTSSVGVTAVTNPCAGSSSPLYRARIALLELLKAGQTGTWQVTTADNFRPGDAAHNRHASRKTLGRARAAAYALCPATAILM